MHSSIDESLYLQLTLMSRRNSSNSRHGTLAFSYLQLLILQWYILLFRRISDADRSAWDSDSRVGSGTSGCRNAVATVAAATADNVSHRVEGLCSCLIVADSSECIFDVLEAAVLEFRDREALADGPRTDAEIVAAAVVHTESSDESSERFVSLASERFSSRSKSSIQFLRSFRYDLRRE